MGRKKVFKGNKKYRLVPNHPHGDWTLQEYRCLSKPKNKWEWIAFKWPSSLGSAIDGLISLHLDPTVEVNFELTYPSNFVPEDYPIQVPLNVSVDDLQAVQASFNAIREDLLAKLPEIMQNAT